jgi:MFS family permease
MWSAVVAQPAVQAAFGIARANASLPFTLAMLGFACGGPLMGRIADRFGIVVTVVGGTVALAVGYVLSAFTTALWQFALAYAVIGVGSSATFAPLMADISHWFTQRRGIAVAVASCSNYLAGAVWPLVVEYFIAAEGWRHTHAGVGVLCLLTILPLTFFALRPRAPMSQITPVGVTAADPQRPLGLSLNALQAALMIAGVCCCVTMATPLVQIVPYCGDLGYGAARGAEILSLMLGLGVVSRLVCGAVADRIGGLKTLLLMSSLQALSILPFMRVDGLVLLYAISGVFGLFQGGIISTYAIIVREYFPAQEAGTRVGAVIGATLLGMALGGWISGAIFDFTGSYLAVFVNAFIWNLFNISIVLWLLSRSQRSQSRAVGAAI